MKKKKETSNKIANKEIIKKIGNQANTVSSFIVEYKTPILIIGGAVLGFYFIKKAREGIASAFDEKSEQVQIDLPIDIKKTTITKTQSKQFAQQLLDASNHMAPLYGTDEATIKEVFLQLKTAEDFKLVYEAFGNKNYNGWNSPPVGIFRHLDNYQPRDLVYWLKSELEPSDGEVYDIVKARVESAGWTFKKDSEIN
ncbi:hypothetical protein [uncultured Tenacibaculum sp.]|uniref:hypothetical protein n=1 Tax=uncultured Tenacibaculum sp. TaxID=174713 RepID=UPI0026109652|nr:hypothetical protein [uncultured Tenacibaculum sp.]